MSLSTPFIFIKGTTKQTRLGTPFIFLKGITRQTRLGTPFTWTQERRVRYGGYVRAKQIRGSSPLPRASFSASALPSALAAGYVIFVTDESGGPTLAFSDGSNWLRYADRAVVS